MFNSIQKNIYSWVVIFIFIIITIIFIITIIPLKNKENNRSTFIAKVDQHIINITEFNKLYNNAILELNGSNLNDNHKQIIKSYFKKLPNQHFPASPKLI